jgi:hypothetical protein
VTVGSNPINVMAGLVPAIHVFLTAAKTWMPGTRPGMTTSEVRSRVKLRYGLKIAAPVVALLSSSVCAFAASFSA